VREHSKPLFSTRLNLDGNRTHIVSEAEKDFEVWLNTDISDFDGLCIGCGQTRQDAVNDAVSVLRQALQKLTGTTVTTTGATP
jgi:hypothetical protein